MNLDIKIPEKLKKSFENLNSGLYKYLVWYGGRGSGKSESLCAIAILESFIDDGTILCCREIQNSIDQSVKSSIERFIYKNNLSDYFYITNKEIINLKTNAKFIFRGLMRNTESVKSIDKLRVVLVDEAENVSQYSWDVLTPTPRYGKVRIYVVFNPRFENDPTYQEFVAKNEESMHVVNINWRDNPWFPESLEIERQRALKGDKGRYNWIWEGKFKKIADDAVFAKKVFISNFEIEGLGEPLLGIDWGFSSSAMAVVECYVNDNILYVRNAKTKTEVENNDLVEFILSTSENFKKYTSRADCSRPETISHVKKKLRLIVPCIKGKGSVEDGISYIQSFDRIIFHTDAEEASTQFCNYKFKKDKFDKPTDIPLKIDDHVADAIRYALEPLIKLEEETLSYKNLL